MLYMCRIVEKRLAELAAGDAHKYAEVVDADSLLPKPSVEVLLELANSSLATFLLKERLALVSGYTERLSIHSEENVPAENRVEVILKLVDTLLFKLLVECDDPRWKQLIYEVYHPIFCLVEDSADFLSAIQRSDALAILMTHYQRYEEALELWGKIHTKEITISEPCVTKSDPLNEIAEILASMKRQTNASQLLLKYGKLLFNGNPQLGLHLFTMGNIALSISPDEAIDLITVSCNEPEAMVELYLEHIIMRQRYVEPAQKTRLALIYIDKVLELQAETVFTASGRRYLPAGKEPGKLGMARSKLLNYLETSSNLDVPRLLKVIESTWLTEERVILLCKSGFHNEALELLATTLRDVPKAELYCHSINSYLQPYVDTLEVAEYYEFRNASEIIYPITGPFPVSLFTNASDASTLSVSSTTAIQGKRQAVVGKEGEDSRFQSDTQEDSVDSVLSLPQRPHMETRRSAGMFFFLLKKLVQSWINSKDEEEGCDYYRAASVNLLLKYGGHPDLDPLQVIPILPDVWPLSEIMPYFFSCLRRGTHSSITTSIQENLASMAYLNTFSQWADVSSQSVLISSDTLCNSCGLPIGDNPFAADLNGNNFHVSCVKGLKNVMNT